MLINTCSLEWEKLSRNYILALYTRSVSSTVNIWVSKGMERVPCPLSSILLLVWSYLVDTGFGKRRGWSLEFAVRNGFFRDCRVFHILLLWAREALTHQVSCLNDGDVKSTDTSYSDRHFRKLAYSALYQWCSVQAWSWIKLFTASFAFISSGRVRNGSGCRVPGCL